GPDGPWVFNDDGALYRGGMVPRDFYQAQGSSEQLAMDTRLRAEFFTGEFRHEVMIGVQYQDVTTETDTAYAYALGYDFVTAGPDAVLGDTYWLNLFDPQYGNFPSADIMDQFFLDSPAANTID